MNAKNIRSKKVNGVLQEVYAALTATSIIQGLRYLFEKVKTLRRVSFKARAWRLETAFNLLALPDSFPIGNALEPIIRIGHKIQPGRSYPRFSRQPEGKWIKEKRKSASRRLRRQA